MKKVIIDHRMRQIEKDALTMRGYELVELQSSDRVYGEISSHVDIFCAKVKNELIVEKSRYTQVKEKLGDNGIVICGESMVASTYPQDIAYNICSIGEYVIHNFKYTDKAILASIERQGLKMISVKQGYSNCDIAVIDDNSAIVTNKKIADMLRENKIEVLLVEEGLAIKLLDQRGKISKMQGLIGGCFGKIGNEIMVFGDLTSIDPSHRIREFIQARGLSIIEIIGLEVIDYGGIIEM